MLFRTIFWFALYELPGGLNIINFVLSILRLNLLEHNQLYTFFNSLLILLVMSLILLPEAYKVVSSANESTFSDVMIFLKDKITQVFLLLLMQLHRISY